MGEYRLYCVNDQGRFSKSHDIIADSDEQAIEKAAELKLPVTCELWQQGRFVAALNSHDAQSNAD